MANKEYLYVGHYIDVLGYYMLKIGTTNDLKRRKKEHTRNYKKSPVHTMPPDGEFEYDFTLPLSKYNTLRYEDKNRERWQGAQIGGFVRNDRICRLLQIRLLLLLAIFHSCHLPTVKYYTLKVEV